jgi:uncharacterized protein
MATVTNRSSKLTRSLVQEIVSSFRPKRITLFGSYAYGEPHEDSDLDLLVVTDHLPSRRERTVFTHKLHDHSPLPLQLVFMSPEEFEETKDVVGGLAYPAHHWGQLLYVQDT